MTPIALPWPDKALSPNSRTHWAAKAITVKAHRSDGYWNAYIAGWGRWPKDVAPTVTITFQPPDNRRRDTDNMLASCKAYLDGIADALGVDDSRWTLRIERIPAKAPGAVMVRVTA